ncbi:hypothetical protein Kpol_480p6 [Vanderwaltozyma polyspora DSM 70294]|uniref:Vacuolar protein sorting-associated protein 62 n=1 Tax=Vanderwaltozyma polyspora (strain ATCC 22028 / DSM 70294 / BCRC 21397 / CBS 2163 / NBRC 10782 / NRRL Y-8283 / UCD 57-17) TaxID=436907 RepID=A7TP68_VANPO|nr:uncharacterized protein Kpol_480p6 [Vanderwaltozyma polyspora DSM 70294]EDO15919.1 hypothetical protein Kpol_480p6 [Vanderwaltozyma polyspora DSM 70294]
MLIRLGELSFGLKSLLLLAIIVIDGFILASPVSWLFHDPFITIQKEDSSNNWLLPPLLDPDDITDDNRSLPKNGSIPSYIVDNCPVVYLHSEERYWPSDIEDYVTHFSINDGNGNVIINASNDDPLKLKDLNSGYKINFKNGSKYYISSEDTYMTSLDNFDNDPKWLLGHKPEYGTGHIKKGPVILFAVDKGNGWVDAFWFYFYPFNWGPFIMGYGPWGNHVGDWEHSLVRFYKGKPKYLWMSAHSGGTAYKFEAIEKIKKLRHVNGRLTSELIERPVIFSARGTHANYASTGQHPHDVPFFFMPLSDFTDRGPMWDPVLNYYSYVFDGTNIIPSSEKEEKLGIQWLQYHGTWGDKQLAWKDPRQRWCPVQWKYIDGPTGPLYKNIERMSLCQSTKWWNFLNSCPARRFIKKGNGLNAEKNDLIGDNCGVLLYWIRPKWFRGILRFLTWRGILCFIMDFFTG